MNCYSYGLVNYIYSYEHILNLNQVFIVKKYKLQLMFETKWFRPKMRILHRYLSTSILKRRSDTVHLIIRLNDAIRYYSYIFSLKSLKMLKPDRYASNI